MEKDKNIKSGLAKSNELLEKAIIDLKKVNVDITFLRKYALIGIEAEKKRIEAEKKQKRKNKEAA